MSLTTRAKACLLCAVLAVPALGLADPAMQEGNWEVTMKMEMVGMPFPMPPMTVNQCVTKKDLVPDVSQRDQNCIVNDQKVTGDTLTWRMHCKGAQGSMDGEGRIKYSGDTYEGEMQANMTDKSGKAMAIKYAMHGKHTGACKADSKKAKRADDY
jgi:uncharacterized protein DUF3617